MVLESSEYAPLRIIRFTLISEIISTRVGWGFYVFLKKKKKKKKKETLITNVSTTLLSYIRIRDLLVKKLLPGFLNIEYNHL